MVFGPTVETRQTYRSQKGVVPYTPGSRGHTKHPPTPQTIRFIAWDPRYLRIAVATCDDIVRVYFGNSESILNDRLQRGVTSIAWRPLCDGQLAVGCDNGALIWSINPRRIIPPTQLKHGQYSSTVNSVEWKFDGSLLATLNLNDSSILLWNVDLGAHYMPLKPIGPVPRQLLWSPDGGRLCATTTTGVLRVWSTSNWKVQPSRLACGSIISAAWSPCGGHLLFLVANNPILFRIRFCDEHLSTIPDEAVLAVEIMDLTKINKNGVSDDINARPELLAWDPTGRYLAVTYTGVEKIAIFCTSIKWSRVIICPNCYIMGKPTEMATYICFRPRYSVTADSIQTVLTVGWSSGRVQYIPFR